LRLSRALRPALAFRPEGEPPGFHHVTAARPRWRSRRKIRCRGRQLEAVCADMAAAVRDDAADRAAPRLSAPARRWRVRPRSAVGDAPSDTHMVSMPDETATREAGDAHDTAADATERSIARLPSPVSWRRRAAPSIRLVQPECFARWMASRGTGDRMRIRSAGRTEYRAVLSAMPGRRHITGEFREAVPIERPVQLVDGGRWACQLLIVTTNFTIMSAAPRSR
jgi:hypothetical protein